MPWSEEAARVCGITWLLNETAPAGAFGRAARARRPPFVAGDEERATRAIAECADLAMRAGTTALEGLRGEIARVPDLAPAAERARAGETLADADFYEAGRFVASLRAIGAVARGRSIALAAELDGARLGYADALAPGTRPAGGFYLADAFDPALAAARGRLEEARVRADLERTRIDRAVAAIAGRDGVRSGEFVVMRDRLTGPLPSQIRVLREAPTYVLCEAALDDAALAAIAAFEDTESEVAACEDAVRVRLSEAIARDAEAIAAATQALGELDVLASNAAFAARHDTCVPQLETELALDVEHAQFLPLAANARGYVPLDFDLGPASVLTGANMGGKTTALRTAGFIAACVAHGLPVPAKRARLCIFSRIEWLAPGDREGLEDGLSAFGAEIVRARSVLEGAPSRALVLIDEFARTTTPRDGRALLVALIERLRERGALVFAATHASGVAAASGATAYAVAGLRGVPPSGDDGPLAVADALAAIATHMDYRILRAGSDLLPSDAIALARALGLERGVADRADAIVRETDA